MRNFRLVSAIKLFIERQSKTIPEVYVVSPDDKVAINNIKRQYCSDKIIEEHEVVNEDITVRIKDQTVYISSPNFPNPSIEYILKNISTSSLWDIISYTKIDCGVIEGTFEIAVGAKGGDYTTVVKLINPSMPVYMNYLNEMVRYLNCQTGKKKRVWEIGHRYDSEEKSYYYLGSVHVRNINPSNSEYNLKPQKEVNLFVEDIKDAKTISDVFSKGIINLTQYQVNCGDYYCIQGLYSPKCLVDCGKYLEDDGTTILDYLDSITFNTINLIESGVDIYGYNEYINLVLLFEIFKVCNMSGDVLKLSEGSQDLIKNLINEVIYSIFYEFWDCPGKPRNIDKDLSLEGKEQKVFTNFLTIIRDCNVSLVSYYKTLIDNNPVLSEAFNKISEYSNTWDDTIYTQDFEKHLKYRRGNSFIFTTRTEKSSRYKLNIVKVSDTIDKDSALFEEIVSIVDDTRNGMGPSTLSYVRNNVGTKNNPLIYESFLIGVEDICSKYIEKGIEIPENLKYDILRFGFRKLTLMIDLGEKVE